MKPAKKERWDGDGINRCGFDFGKVGSHQLGPSCRRKGAPLVVTSFQ